MLKEILEFFGIETLKEKERKRCWEETCIICKVRDAKSVIPLLWDDDYYVYYLHILCALDVIKNPDAHTVEQQKIVTRVAPKIRLHLPELKLASLKKQLGLQEVVLTKLWTTVGVDR